jgi:NAD(P)H dehydrogenase (quinone)
MTIAITGISGQLGRLIADTLAAHAPDVPLVGLARTPDAVAIDGVDVRRFDYDDPATLVPALAGVDTLMLVSSSAVGQRKRQHRAVIDAAKAAGVGRIAYTSLLHAGTSSLSLADEHIATERMLAESGIAYTILRNGWYTENYTASVPPALTHGAFVGSAGDGRIASAARADFAEAAAAVLTGDGHAGQVYELAGDNAYTLTELAAELSRQVGRDIPYVDLAEADYAAALVGAGLPQPLATALASYDVAAAGGALFHDGDALARLIGRPTTPLATSIAAALPR